MRRFLLGAIVTSCTVAAGIDASIAQTADSGTPRTELKFGPIARQRVVRDS